MARVSIADRLHQSAFAVLYPWARLLASLTGHRAEAAAVAVWHKERLLIVKHSYLRCVTLPGGHIDGQEPPARAAARELAEEVGIDVSPSQIGFFGRFELRQSRLSLFECYLDHAPRIKIDNREITAAAFVDPTTIADPSLMLRRYFRAKRLVA